MEPLNFSAWMAQQRVLEASDIVAGDDLIAIGKKINRRRDGEQYQEFAMTLSEFGKLFGGSNDLVYEALLDQYAPAPASELSGPLRIGEVYEIGLWGGGDFSNIAQVISGTINTTGCVFRATGTTPTSWGLTGLMSKGWPIARVIENTIDPDIYWVRPNDISGAPYKGWYYAVSPNNAFIEDKTIMEQPLTPQMVLNNPSFFNTKGGIVISFSGSTGANNEVSWLPDYLTLQTGIADAGGFVTLQDDILRRTRVKIIIKQEAF